jgi:protein-export membrane protein SecD
MKQRTRHIVILGVVVALVAGAIFFIIPPNKKTHLGLDLQGGLEVIFQAKTTKGQIPSSDQMSQAIGIMDRRVNGLGVTESQVQLQGRNQISVALPGVTNQQQALNIIGKTAQLEFYVDADTRIAGPAASQDAVLKSAVGLISKAAMQKLQAYAAAVDAHKKNPQSSVPDFPDVNYRLIEAPAGVVGSSSTTWYLYLHKPAMTGGAIKPGGARQGFDQFSKPNVLIDFTGPGGKAFEQVTKQLALAGALKGQNQSFAIVLDNQMESDPIVNYQENPQGIAGGSAEITGSFTLGEAKDLALVLNTGALPVNLTVAEQQQVSAVLGKDSLHAGIIAGAIGLGLVLIFMVVVYRFLGVIADLALIIYAILLWGVFNAVPVTLTLPGIAGMILTIGVAADANVVVFERIKEEVRRGKSVRSAINSGYGKGFKTILDANILIILTALVLFYFATAQPKGFALTLMIGTVVSLFTAVLATRAMLGLLSNFSFFNKAEFMGAHSGEVLFEGEFDYDGGPEAGGSRRRRAAGSGARAPQARPASAARPKPDVPVLAADFDADEPPDAPQAPAAPAAAPVAAASRPGARNSQRRPVQKKRKKRR